MSSVNFRLDVWLVVGACRFVVGNENRSSAVGLLRLLLMVACVPGRGAGGRGGIVWEALARGEGAASCVSCCPWVLAGCWCVEGVLIVCGSCGTSPVFLYSSSKLWIC